MEERKSKRIESIDLLRGIVMVLMALDHVRDYFHASTGFGGSFSPVDLEQTTAAIFLTRFITHFCAPVFVFLAGTSAYLYGQKTGRGKLFRFLLSRGIWLVIVEIALMNFLWWFDPAFGFINLQVIWAIGICMIALSVLVFLPKKVLLLLGLVIVAGHNFLDPIEMEGQNIFSIGWYILHQGGFITLGEDRFMGFSYPVLPWIGVIILGYVFGSLYTREVTEQSRKKWLLWLGSGSILLFLLLRFPNIYGDPVIWTSQKNTLFTIFSFLNLEKYPPSLHYLLVTLGIGFFFLFFVEKVKNRATSFLIVFGRVPFFYYVLHILLIHLLAIGGLLLTGKDWHAMILNNENYENQLLQGYGYNLWVVYLVWILVVAILYYPSKKYMEYKMRNRTKWWLSYL